jgi:glutamate--cysteine ligase
MSNLGYKSEAQKSLFVCYNDLETYVDCLHSAIHTPYDEYTSIGQYFDGEYQQINTNLLQLENEFYSTIRPKRNVKPGEKPLEALTNSGIEYIEVRALDLDPYSSLGINEEQIRFLDSFLLHCLLADSPDCNENEFFEVANNVGKVVEHGRNPDLMLDKENSTKNLKEWSLELIEELSYSACLLDNIHQTTNYHSSLIAQAKKVDNPDLTPSGRMLTEMQEGNLSFFDFSMKQSRLHHQTLSKAKLDEKALQYLQKISGESLVKQKKIEDSDEISFDEFLRQWNET